MDGVGVDFGGGWCRGGPWMWMVSGWTLDVDGVGIGVAGVGVDLGCGWG